jgi:hypothetical protein
VHSLRFVIRYARLVAHLRKVERPIQVRARDSARPNQIRLLTQVSEEGQVLTPKRAGESWSVTLPRNASPPDSDLLTEMLATARLEA